MLCHMFCCSLYHCSSWELMHFVRISKTDITLKFRERQRERDRRSHIHALIFTCMFRRTYMSSSFLFAGAKLFLRWGLQLRKFYTFHRSRKKVLISCVNISWNKDQMSALAPVFTFSAGVINYIFYTPTAARNSKKMAWLALFSFSEVVYWMSHLTFWHLTDEAKLMQPWRNMTFFFSPHC